MPAIFGRRVEIAVHLRGSTTADRTVPLTVRLTGRFMGIPESQVGDGTLFSC
jgi:hypothetical protein